MQAAVTWTPGDVNIAQKKGGLVSIVSTKEYASQMPHVIIGIDKWMKANRPIVEGMLKAMMEGSEKVASDPAMLQQASAISAKVYNEQDAAYWAKYYKGVQEADKAGVTVDLGGSAVNNLADNLLWFGLKQGAANKFAATYQQFGDIVVKQYPKLIASYDPAPQITDTSYLQNLAGSMTASAPVGDTKPPTTNSTTPGGKKAPVLSSGNWDIHFDTGKDTIRAESRRTLESLMRTLVIASSTTVEIHGHTDNKGNHDANYKLSEARAFAVKDWLEKKYPVNFPQGRIQAIAHGPDMPIGRNDTEDGRAKNRRVQIVIRGN